MSLFHMNYILPYYSAFLNSSEESRRRIKKDATIFYKKIKGEFSEHK